jgi:SAM-dependent methyltransferase
LRGARQERFGWSKAFFDLVGAPANAKILDIGCGPAHFWQWGLENDRVLDSWSMTLTDLSRGMLDEAKRNVSSSDANFTFDKADVCDLQFEDESFDIVTANYMLYHASSQTKAISEIHRVLKPGGRLLAATNSDRHTTEITELQDSHLLDPSQRGASALFHMAFTRENGGDMLREKFSHVEIVPDESISRATDPQILIDYVMSLDADVDEKRLSATVRQHISREGHFAATRASGLFVAQK